MGIRRRFRYSHSARSAGGRQDCMRPIHRPFGTSLPALVQPTALALLALGLTAGCGTTKTARTGPAAPKWFNSPPKAARSLYFVGSASGAFDEQTARELAVQKALSDLTVFCGAQIKSDFQSEEVERNGKLTQSVSLTVDIAGDELTIREAEIKASETGPGSDGTWDAYALIQWPKAQYEAVLASQRQRAERALAVFLEADAAAKRLQLAQAQDKLKEAKMILGPMKAQVPLKHGTFTNSGLLWDAVQALKARLAELDKERRRVFHVAVLCAGQSTDCPSHRTGAVTSKVATLGFKVSATGVPPEVAGEIVTSSNPKQDASMRSAGFVLAVRYDGKLTAREDGFVFTHCGARGVVYDTDANRIVAVHEVKPMKAGHVHVKGALEKSCAKAEKNVMGWLDTTLPSFK